MLGLRWGQRGFGKAPHCADLRGWWEGLAGHVPSPYLLELREAHPQTFSSPRVTLELCASICKVSVVAAMPPSGTLALGGTGSASGRLALGAGEDSRFFGWGRSWQHCSVCQRPCSSPCHVGPTVGCKRWCSCTKQMYVMGRGGLPS